MTAMARRNTALPRLEDDPEWTRFVEDVRTSADIRHVIATVAGVAFSPKGKVTGEKVLCPFHNEKSPSFNVRANVGLYHCFGCGADGDVFRFVREHDRLNFPRAVARVAELSNVAIPEKFTHLRAASGGPVPAKKASFRVERAASETHQFLTPPPDVSLPGPGSQSYWSPLKADYLTVKISKAHIYRDPFGAVESLVLRVQRGDGKYFTPLTWADPAIEPDLPIDSPGWIARGYPPQSERGIYGIERVLPLVQANALKGILFVEGEKCADAANDLFARHPDWQGWVGLSPQGGQNAIGYMKWQQLATALEGLSLDPINDDDLQLVAWPDADPLITRENGTVHDRQSVFVDGILGGAKAILTQDQRSIERRVTVPEGKSDGWDIADAIEDGMDPVTILAMIRNAEEYAPPAPPEEAAPEPVGDDEVVVRPTPEAVDGEVDPAPQDDGEGNGIDEMLREQAVNDWCRALGYDQDHYYFLPRAKGQIVAVTASGMRPQTLLTLAPRSVWEESFGSLNQRNEMRIDWERAYDFLIRSCHTLGVWTRRSEARAGARTDCGRVVFNSGQHLWVEGVGSSPLTDSYLASLPGSRMVYTVGADIGRPDTVRAFEHDDEEIISLRRIVNNINWRSENRALYALSFLGWLAIAPICGALVWRPMVWLDGPRGAGKSWIIENIAAKVLGAYAHWVKSNSTESGIRNELNGSTLPILFDEAEGEESSDRNRMDAILKLARHAATPGDSMVLQGQAGGGSNRSFAIQTTILFSSITPQLRHSADRSRFAQLSLAGGLPSEEFERRLVEPCSKLFEEPGFRARFLGRMLGLANKVQDTKQHIARALMHDSQLEQRTADVFATLLAGAFLLTESEEDHFEDWESADNWLSSVGVKKLIVEHGEAIKEDKDHDRMMSTLLAYPLMVSTGGGPLRTRIGVLIQSALELGEPNPMISSEAAAGVLAEMGIKVHAGHRPIAGKNYGQGIFVHKDYQPIREALKDTPYGTNYQATLRQIEGAESTGPIRFPGAGAPRAIFIPVDSVLRGFANRGEDDFQDAKN